MKKRFIIILVIQSVIILLMSIFAFIQKLEADKNLVESVMQKQLANKAMERAIELEKELMMLKRAQDDQAK